MALQPIMANRSQRRAATCTYAKSEETKLSTLNLSSIVNAGYDQAIERLRESVAEVRESQAVNSSAVVEEMTAAIADEEEKALKAMEQRVTVLVNKVEKEEASVEAALDGVRSAQTEAASFEVLVQIYAAASLLIAAALSFVGFNYFLGGGSS